MQRFRDKYGDRPLLIRLPGRVEAVILAPRDVRRVLEATPEPFAAASTEKRATLSHFEPRGVLTSRGEARCQRRYFNDATLESDRPCHHLAPGFCDVVRREGAELVAEVERRETLTWGRFVVRWYRIVRRVVLGATAADDHELTDLLGRLRADANWAFLHPIRKRTRQRFFDRLQAHLDRAEPGSLAAVAASIPETQLVRAVDQVPQWLFAFDAAGIALFRALALVVSHPMCAMRAREEISETKALPAPELPFLRASILESVRLWPTTPLILRQTTTATALDSGLLDKGSGVLIYVPFFHRDDTRLSFADKFSPDQWLDAAAPEAWPLIPFSAGPAACPGREIVLLLASTLLATLLGALDLRLQPPNCILPNKRIPATLDPFTLRYSVGAVRRGA
jgi:cytochrome P450